MNKLPLIITTILLLIFLYSCKKEPSQIGMNIQSGDEQVELVSTTLGVSAFTVSDENIASNQRSLSPLGEYTDPVFGYTKAMFTCQVLLSTGNVDFSAIVNDVNSMKLHLKYNGFYGNITDLTSIRVYRLKKDIYRDSIYYSGFTVDEHEKELLKETELITIGDSLISIDLPQELIDEFINPSNKDSFKDNESFIQFFKGIYVEADNQNNPGGGILYIDLINSTSGIELRYNDTAYYNFNITTSSSIINQFEHDYTNSPDIINVLNDTLNNNEFCYVQSLGGLKTKIEFPELINEFKDKDIIGIHKAQLIITIKQDADIENYPPPETLNLIAITENHKSEFLTDYKVNSEKFGGVLNSLTYQYVFNIPFHVQELINDREDFGLYLLPANNRISAGRAILYGGAHNDNELSMKLKILYSK